MKDFYYIPMYEENIEKIELGLKTSTLRSKESGEKIGLPIGIESKAKIGKNFYMVKNLGLLTIEEAGGKEFIEQKECFGKNGPLFKQTSEWLDGFGKMYVYLIIKKL